MGLTLQNFNRIISIEFLDDNGLVIPNLSINCPETGRKPNIEINGLLADKTGIVSNFNVKIKNLYLEDLEGEYTHVRVTAGYAGAKKQSFTGSIMYMYKEAPGPEGTTVIQCLQGVKFTDVIKTTIANIGDTEGKSFQDILRSVSIALNFDEPIIDEALAMKTLSYNLIIDNCSVSGAVEKLVKAFSNESEEVVITYAQNRLRATLRYSDFGVTYIIPYLTTPPQLIGQDGGGSVVTFSAPWNPEILPGDLVTINTKFYKTKTFKTSSHGLDTTYQVINIQFQFGTCGSINQMVIQGLKV